MVGLSIFQAAVFLLYITHGQGPGGTAPIVAEGIEIYSNPLPHVLILTAIVVGVATLALGLALVVRIREAYGTIEEDEIGDQDGPAMMTAHLPALQVVLPLLAAPACILVRGRDLAWAGSRWSRLGGLRGLVRLLLDQVLESGVISYELGGWAAPFGIEYRVDALNAFVLLIVSGIGAVVLPFTPRSLLIEMVGEKRAYLFYCAFLLCVTGLLGIAITGDAFNLFVFMEISSLASYAS